MRGRRTSRSSIDRRRLVRCPPFPSSPLPGLPLMSDPLSPWDAGLRELVAEGVLTGYALLTPTRVLAARGAALSELWGDVGDQQEGAVRRDGGATPPPPAAAQFVDLFALGEGCRSPAAPAGPSATPIHHARAAPAAAAAADAAPEHLELGGTRAVVVRRSAGSAYAVSRGQRLGLGAHCLPSGVLVTSWARPQLLQHVAPRLERIADALRLP